MIFSSALRNVWPQDGHFFFTRRAVLPPSSKMPPLTSSLNALRMRIGYKRRFLCSKERWSNILSKIKYIYIFNNEVFVFKSSLSDLNTFLTIVRNPFISSLWMHSSHVLNSGNFKNRKCSSFLIQMCIQLKFEQIHLSIYSLGNPTYTRV